MVVITTPTDGVVCDKEINAEIAVAEGTENFSSPDDFAIEFSCGNRAYRSFQPASAAPSIVRARWSPTKVAKRN